MHHEKSCVYVEWKQTSRKEDTAYGRIIELIEDYYLSAQLFEVYKKM